jgi:hypothetical protein
MKECIDCYYSKPVGGGEYKCSAHQKFGTFDGFETACSSFVSDDVEGSCEFCHFYEGGSYRWQTTGMCRVKGVKVKGDSPSCPRYMES